MAGRTPPGRAGRVWLAQRLAVARRAVDLLDRKQQLLRSEQRRLAALVERTEREWRAAVAEAERWCVRAVVAGARDDMRRAAGGGTAQARLVWTTEAGVRYPSMADAQVPPLPELAGGVALSRTAEAYRRALDVSVRHAAASAAASKVAAELAVTTRRLRAVRERLLPDLESRLAALDVRLDEAEREEFTHLRWARGGPADGREQRR